MLGVAAALFLVHRVTLVLEMLNGAVEQVVPAPLMEVLQERAEVQFLVVVAVAVVVLLLLVTT
jgi:hypothetical protein